MNHAPVSAIGGLVASLLPWAVQRVAQEITDTSAGQHLECEIQRDKPICLQYRGTSTESSRTTTLAYNSPIPLTKSIKGLPRVG